MKSFVTIFALNFLYCLGVMAQAEMKHSVWYLKDVNSNFTIDSLLTKNKEFSLLSNNKLSFGHGNSPFWLKISFKNEDTLACKKLLEVEYAFLDEVNLFLENDGKIVYQSDTLGWKYPYSDRIFKHYNPVFLPSTERVLKLPISAFIEVRFLQFLQLRFGMKKIFTKMKSN